MWSSSPRKQHLIVGCGFSGAVLAERIASELDHRVLIIDKRDHIGGNCYDYIDAETGILVHKYGPHIFHTNDERVWRYVNCFGSWHRYEHKVLALVDGRYVPMPVNITTVNELCGESLTTAEDMEKWLTQNVSCYGEITNSEQMAKSRIGEFLYEKLIKHYTKKQWNRDASELSPSVLARIPMHKSFDTRYFADKYQALPGDGYTSVFKKILSHSNITLKTSTDFFQFKNATDLSQFTSIIYTGPIDQYFHDRGLAKLEYRSIDFHVRKFFHMNFYQPSSVVTHPDYNTPFTRTVEYKHFLNQKSPHTLIVSETSNDHGDPYYPVPNGSNMALYEEYRKMAEAEEHNNVFFVGRLANYKYMNMDQAIANALEYFDKIKQCLNS